MRPYFIVETNKGPYPNNDSVPRGVFGPCYCDNCIHSYGGHDSYTGYDLWDCDKLDIMIDKDVESCNRGFCPCWEEVNDD